MMKHMTPAEATEMRTTICQRSDSFVEFALQVARKTGDSIAVEIFEAEQTRPLPGCVRKHKQIFLKKSAVGYLLTYCSALYNFNSFNSQLNEVLDLFRNHPRADHLLAHNNILGLRGKMFIWRLKLVVVEERSLSLVR